MVTKKHTYSVRLDDSAQIFIEKAAKVTHQSCGSLLKFAGEDHARKVLLEWAVAQYKEDKFSFSQLAEQTGLAVEEVMDSVSMHSHERNLALFLASARTAARLSDNPEFYEQAKAAVVKVLEESTELTQ